MKKLFSKIFRVKEWSDWDRNVSIFEYLKVVILRIFVPNAPAKAKKFDTVVKRYQLDNSALQNQSQTFKFLSFMFFVFALLIDAYAIFLCFKADWFRAAVVICISCISYGFAFRYHFYYTLIKFKRLDCSLKDWYKLNFTKAGNV